MGGSARESHQRTTTPSSAPGVGLVLAAAMAPGTFTPSLTSRTALDQGLVTGLSTGLHFLLAAGAQDALVATARFLVGGTASPAARHTAAIAVDAAAVPLGLAVLRALPPRAEDPLRGAVRQAAWRLGATGLSGALLGFADAGAHALDDRLGLGGRLAAVPLAVPVGLGIAYVGDRLRRGEHAERTDGVETAPPLSSAGVAVGIVGCLAGAAYGEQALTDLLARRLAAVLPGPPDLWRLAGHAGFLVGLGLGASAVWHRAMRRIESMTSAEEPRVLGRHGTGRPAARPRIGPPASRRGPATRCAGPLHRDRHGHPRARGARAGLRRAGQRADGTGKGGPGAGGAGADRCPGPLAARPDLADRHGIRQLRRHRGPAVPRARGRRHGDPPVLAPPVAAVARHGASGA